MIILFLGSFVTFFLNFLIGSNFLCFSTRFIKWRFRKYFHVFVTLKDILFETSTHKLVWWMYSLWVAVWLIFIGFIIYIWIEYSGIECLCIILSQLCELYRECYYYWVKTHNYSKESWHKPEDFTIDFLTYHELNSERVV